MDTHSILDKKLPQAAPKTASSNPAHLSSPSMTAGAAAARAMAREALPFPGEDGGKSLSEMAQRDLDATLQLLAERAQYITGASGAAIALRDGENMICCASAGASAPELGAHLQIDSGLSAESVRTRKVLHCEDAETDARVNQKSCRASGIASVVVMPLVRDEEVYGVFELLAGRPRAFEERDFIALQRLAEMIQTAVEHAEAARRAEKLGSTPEAEIEVAVEAETGLMNPAHAPVAENSATTPGTRSPQVLNEHDLDKDDKKALPGITANRGSVPAPRPEPAAAPAVPQISEFKVGETDSDQAAALGPITPIAFGKVRSCQGCGFPISEGRRLCLDCEAATPNVDLGDASQPFGQLTESNPSWIRSHLYLVGTVLIVVATIAVVVWRL
jgi:putative methionine-R-sulfoxide reductase with GAF domain